MVVDDNPLVRAILVDGLASLGEIIPAADGADALLKAVDSPPDLILTDYRMPGLDGRQLCEKLRGRPQTRNIRFLFMILRGASKLSWTACAWKKCRSRRRARG